MNTIVHTEFSAYEVDLGERRMRRLGGTSKPTPNQGTDGEWKSYTSLDVLHDCMLIIWGLDGSILRTTTTSRILAVEGEL